MTAPRRKLELRIHEHTSQRAFSASIGRVAHCLGYRDQRANLVLLRVWLATRAVWARLRRSPRRWWTALCRMLYKMKKVARIPVSEARKNFAKMLELAAKGTRVKVTRYNQTLGGIISGDDLISLKDCEEEKSTALARKRRQNEKHARSARSR
jgi:hypothetical protein